MWDKFYRHGNQIPPKHKLTACIFHKQLKQLYKPRRFIVDLPNNNIDSIGNSSKTMSGCDHSKPFDLDTEEVWGDGWE